MPDVSALILENIEVVTNWAIDTRRVIKALLTASGISVPTLVIDHIGTSRIGKSRLQDYLTSVYYGKKFSLQSGGLSEPQKVITHIREEEDEKGFYEAEYKLVFDKLREVVDPASIIDLFIFDRGPDDLYVRTNELMQKGVFTEDQCRQKCQDIMKQVDGAVGLVFVFTDDVMECIGHKYCQGSEDWSASHGIEAEDLKENVAWRTWLQVMYKNFFLNQYEESSKGVKIGEQKPSRKFISLVGHVVDMDARKLTGKDDDEKYEQMFQQAVIIIDFYLVFKAWETLFRSTFASRLEEPNRDAKALRREIIDLADILKPLFRGLLLQIKGGRIIEGSYLWKILESYVNGNLEFVIARHGDVRVIMKNILSPSSTFEVPGL